MPMKQWEAMKRPIKRLDLIEKLNFPAAPLLLLLLLAPPCSHSISCQCIITCLYGSCQCTAYKVAAKPEWIHNIYNWWIEVAPSPCHPDPPSYKMWAFQAKGGNYAVAIEWNTKSTFRLCGDGKEVLASRSGARGVGNNICLVLKINQTRFPWFSDRQTVLKRDRIYSHQGRMGTIVVSFLDPLMSWGTWLDNRGRHLNGF